ncbi:zinc finger protein 595 [Patella vulgata]|uniref:zinc finger protein 595 n=1 Tax=Patella vulgata TaxID=6465 RepID=UPI0024A9621D|nr:zinc finger protein 595 [Patella vulgata]
MNNHHSNMSSEDFEFYTKSPSLTTDSVHPPPLPGLPPFGKTCTSVEISPDISQPSLISENGIKKIMEICENHVIGQTRSVQEIVNICSKMAGYEYYCNQIVAFCNQIFSETLTSSHTIINLCKSFTHLDLTVTVKDSVSKNDLVLRNIKEEAPSTSEEKLDSVVEQEGNNSEIAEPFGSLETSVTDFLDSEKTFTSSNSKKKPRKSHPVKLQTVEQETSAEELSDQESESEHYSSDPDWTTDLSSTASPEKKSPKRLSSTKKTNKNVCDPIVLSIKKSSIPKKKSDKPVYNCSFCSKKFRLKHNMLRHKLLHEKQDFPRKKTEKKEYKCELCGLVCPYNAAFLRHMRSHTGEKPFVCEVCGSAYADNQSLKNHQLTHSDNKPVACELCSYRCRSKKQLKHHMIVHSNEKKYQCDECGKQFARNDDLKRHKLGHSGVKNYACEQCGKRFARNNHLKEHRAIHNDEMPYSCEICGKQSRQAYNIVVHMRTHTGHKPFACEKCGKKFAHNVSLRQHRNTCPGSDMLSGQQQTKVDLPRQHTGSRLQGKMDMLTGQSRNIDIMTGQPSKIVRLPAGQQEDKLDLLSGQPGRGDGPSSTFNPLNYLYGNIPSL